MSYGPVEIESARYRGAREKLLEAERELRDQREKVANLRRSLPLETVVEDDELCGGGESRDRAPTGMGPKTWMA